MESQKKNLTRYSDCGIYHRMQFICKGGDSEINTKNRMNNLKEVQMKRLFTIAVAFMLLIWISGCQIPGGGEALGKLTEAIEQMDEIQEQLDDIQMQLDEITDAFNSLADEYDKHLEKYHKAKPIKKHIIKKGPSKKITK